MKSAVVADTGPLYALADPSDQFHVRAHRELELLTAQDCQILIPLPVLCEAHTLVLRRLGGKYAADWLGEILAGSSLVNPDTSDYLEATRSLTKYSDHPITLVDAVLARLTVKLHAPAWSFDRHFVTIRTNLWRSVRPA